MLELTPVARIMPASLLCLLAMNSTIHLRELVHGDTIESLTVAGMAWRPPVTTFSPYGLLIGPREHTMLGWVLILTTTPYVFGGGENSSNGTEPLPATWWLQPSLIRVVHDWMDEQSYKAPSVSTATAPTTALS